MKCVDSQLPSEPAKPVPMAERFSWKEALGLVLILCVVGVVAFVAHSAGMLFCLFRKMTGFSCPCCGTTRACLAVLRGDFVGALTHNPLAVAVIVLGPFIVWLRTQRKTWPRFVVITATVLGWVAFWLNWAYLLFRDLSQR